MLTTHEKIRFRAKLRDSRSNLLKLYQEGKINGNDVLTKKIRSKKECNEFVLKNNDV